jgi:DNA-binding CsgD family transcriptional regulator
VHEISARGLVVSVDAAERGGISGAELLHGLPFDATTLRRMRRVRWDDYVVVVERLEELAGGPERLQQLLEDTYHQVIPEIRWAAGVLLGPKALLSFVIEVIDPIVFTPIMFELEDLGPDRVRVAMRLRPGARPCLAWFSGTIGALRGFSRHLELPPAEVAADIGAEHGVYDILLPPSRSAAAVLGRKARDVLDRTIARVIGVGDDDVLPPVTASANVELSSRLEAAVLTWSLTPKQSAVLERVVRGDSNKMIARDLFCSPATVEFHLTRILEKAEVPTRAKLIARFWTD